MKQTKTNQIKRQLDLAKQNIRYYTKQSRKTNDKEKLKTYRDKRSMNEIRIKALQLKRQNL